MKKKEGSNAIYKPEENKLVLTGKLTLYRHSFTQYSGDKEPYQVSILTEDLTPELIAALKERYFADTKDKYLPSFIKDVEERGYDEPVYINLKSDYPFGSFVDGQGNKRYDYDAVLELGEGLPPLYSDVKLSCRLKDGAIYPLALLFTKINKIDAAEFFE